MPRCKSVTVVSICSLSTNPWLPSACLRCWHGGDPILPTRTLHHCRLDTTCIMRQSGTLARLSLVLPLYIGSESAYPHRSNCPKKHPYQRGSSGSSPHPGRREQQDGKHRNTAPAAIHQASGDDCAAGDGKLLLALAFRIDFARLAAVRPQSVAMCASHRIVAAGPSKVPFRCDKRSISL
jgi:hypothetical protein